MARRSLEVPRATGHRVARHPDLRLRVEPDLPTPSASPLTRPRVTLAVALVAGLIDDHSHIDEAMVIETFGPSLEALARVLTREVDARIHIHTAHDITALLWLEDGFGFDLTLHRATEAYTLIDEIRKRHVNVVARRSASGSGCRTRSSRPAGRWRKPASPSPPTPTTRARRGLGSA